MIELESKPPVQDSANEILIFFFFNNLTIFFEVDFELKNEFLNIVMAKSFQFALDKIAEAFQKRAENLFNKG